MKVPHATKQPSNQATKQASKQATKQPSNQATKQSSNQATRQPEKKNKTGNRNISNYTVFTSQLQLRDVTVSVWKRQQCSATVSVSVSLSCMVCMSICDGCQIRKKTVENAGLSQYSPSISRLQPSCAGFRTHPQYAVATNGALLWPRPRQQWPGRNWRMKSCP